MQTDNEKEYLLKAFDAFKNRIIVISPEFNVLAANSRESEIVGQPCYKAFHHRSSPCKECTVNEVLHTGKPVFRLKQDDSLNKGRKQCFYSYPIFSGSKIDAVVTMDFDFSNTGGLEDNLQLSTAFLQNLILSAVDAVIAADKDGNILIFNEAAEELFGYTVDEAINHLNIRGIYPGLGAHDVMRKLRSEKYGGKGKLKSYQVDVVRKTGQIIPISLNASIVYEQGREMATIGFSHDLREKLRMEKELEKTQIQLLQAEKMASLGKLAAGVAHQLNNPLGGIILFTQIVLEEYELGKEVQDDLRRVLKDAQRCSSIVKELLEFARQTRQNIQDHDINEAISRTLFLLENQTLFHNIDVEKKLANSLPLIPVDIQQMNHLFMNIILNAADAMEGEGKLTVKSYLSVNKNKVCIEISDTGPGIPDDVLPHIFEHFFTTKEEGKGTGLGLSLVYDIVENHGGNIFAESKPGHGATFTIELPILKSDQECHENGKLK